MHIRKQSEEYVQKIETIHPPQLGCLISLRLNVKSYFLRYYPHYHFVTIL